ncbi:hypothetical protein A2U01_0074500, partial [Trifolium medium]|nr:hypothetical protein [Trifolium medium]
MGNGLNMYLNTGCVVQDRE